MDRLLGFIFFIIMILGVGAWLSDLIKFIRDFLPHKKRYKVNLSSYDPLTKTFNAIKD